MMVRVKVLRMFGGVVVGERWMLVDPRHITALDEVTREAYVDGIGWLRLGKGSFRRLREATA